MFLAVNKLLIHRKWFYYPSQTSNSLSNHMLKSVSLMALKIRDYVRAFTNIIHGSLSQTSAAQLAIASIQVHFTALFPFAWRIT